MSHTLDAKVFVPWAGGQMKPTRISGTNLDSQQVDAPWHPVDPELSHLTSQSAQCLKCGNKQEPQDAARRTQEPIREVSCSKRWFCRV